MPTVASNSFTTLDRYVDQDGDLDDSLKTVLIRLIDAASSAMRREIGFDPSYSASWVEEVKSDGRTTVYVSRNVNSVSAAIRLNLDGTTAETLTAGDIYVSPAEKGLLIYENGWPHTGLINRHGVRRAVSRQLLPLLRITYSGGWVTPAQYAADNTLTIPTEMLELEQACIYTVNDWLKSLNREDRLRSEQEQQFAGRRYDLPPTVREICKQYRKDVFY